MSICRLLLIVLLVCCVAVSAEDRPAVKVVSLSPSITETICQMKQEACLVGRSSACDYPAAVRQVPIAGNMGIPFLEKLAALKPDYVLASALRDNGVKKTIESLGIKVVVMPGRTIADYLSSVKVLGEIMRCPAAAEAEALRFTRQLEEFRRLAGDVPAAQRPRVYLEVWHRPLQTCGGKTFLNEMIEYAGGVNIAAGEPREYFTCSEEWILRQNPEVIIAPGMGSGKSGEIAARRGWSEVAAVKQHRIHTGLDQNAIFRLGPRTIDGIAILRECIAGKKP